MTRLQKTALVFAVSVLPHLYGIASPPLDYHAHRQANTADIAKNYHADGLPFLKPRIDWEGASDRTAATELPVYMWLVGLLWGAFGLGATWGRILSVFFSAATAATLYRFLERWIDGEAAFWGALLFSFLPIEIYFGRTIQPESLSLFCYAASLWFFDDYLLNGRKTSWLAAAAGAALTVGHKIPYAHLWLILAFLALCRKGRAALRDPWAWAFFPVSALPVAAWYRYTASVAALEVLPTSTGGIVHLLNYTTKPALLLYYSWYQLFSRFPELTTTHVGLVFFGFGAWAFWRKRLAFFFLWWAGVAAYAIAGGGYTFIHEYTALPFALVNAAFLGQGALELRRKIPAALLVGLVAGMALNGAFRIKHWYRLNYPFLPRVKTVTDKLSRPEDLFFCNNTDSSVYLFMLGRRGWAWDLGQLGESHLGMLDDVTRKGAKFLVTARKPEFEDRSRPVAKHVFDNFQVAYEDEDVLIFRLHPLPAAKT